MMKNWVSHVLFLSKRGDYRIPVSAKKGGAIIRAAHPYYVIYRYSPEGSNGAGFIKTALNKNTPTKNQTCFKQRSHWFII